MRFSLHDSIATGAVVYQETFSTNTSSLGLANVNIGMGASVIGTFSGINWGKNSKFIQVEMDPTGGTNYTDMGTTQMMSVPYALYCANGTPGPQGPAGPVGTGSFTHYIGEVFGGGVVFHLWKDSQGVEHGLIVDKTDLSSGQVWSNVNTTLIGTSAQSKWDGLSNSNSIVGQSGHTNSAAALCMNSTNGGQTDWYLPSLEELNLLWNSQFNVDKSLSTIGGATALGMTYYWSSMEIDFDYAWYFNFINGGASSFSKSSPYSVRAVRAF
jgi:hypothetical protein